MRELKVNNKNDSPNTLVRVSPSYALQLDFYDTRQQSSWPNRSLLLSGLLVTALLAFQFVQTQTSLDTLESQRTTLEQKTHKNARQMHLSPEQLQAMRAEIKDARAVLSQLSLPWGKLFEDIGASQQDQVALLSIVPDVSKHTIKLRGEAKDLNAVLAYIEALQKTPSLGSVYLQSHQIETRSSQQPVRFTLLATWLVKP